MPAAGARNGELVAFCRFARGTRRLLMLGTAWEEGGMATAAIRNDDRGTKTIPEAGWILIRGGLGGAGRACGTWARDWSSKRLSPSSGRGAW
jgi:hypothetical protein